MRGELRVGRILGVPVWLHPSWLLLFGLLAGLLATAYFSGMPAGGSGWDRWLGGVAGAAGFCASLLVHELCHARVAREQGLAVRRVTLFLLGGVATLRVPATTPRLEWEVAVAGPLGSLCLAALFSVAGGLWGRGGIGEANLAGMAFDYLRDANLVLAVFNLVPAYPLDGGRILRALLWQLSGDRVRATRKAARCGRFFAALLAALGLAVAVSGAPAVGMWLFFIGGFLWRIIPLQVEADLRGGD